MGDANLVEIKNFFEMDGTEFAKEWKRLSEEEKAYFKAAVGEALGKK